MFKKLCIIVANSSASLIAKSSALLVADYSMCARRRQQSHLTVQEADGDYERVRDEELPQQ